MLINLTNFLFITYSLSSFSCSSSSSGKISTLQAENQALKFQASQTAQNAFITANQDAQTAELIRRLGADCPSPAYIVPNPNCCYNYSINGVGYGNKGCGCGNYSNF